MPAAWIYIMTNQRSGTRYVGLTSDLARRVWEHREGIAEGFTKRYWLKRLVYAEPHEEVRVAIQRETSIKRWPRAWKVRLIHATNPDRSDLYAELPSPLWLEQVQHNRNRPTLVMAALVAAIHDFACVEVMDGRHKAGHDHSKRTALCSSLLETALAFTHQP